MLIKLFIFFLSFLINANCILQAQECKSSEFLHSEINAKIINDTLIINCNLKSSINHKYFIPISKWVFRINPYGIDLADSYLFTPYISIIPDLDSNCKTWSMGEEFSNFEFTDYFPKLVLVEDSVKTIKIKLVNPNITNTLLKYREYSKWRLSLRLPYTPIETYNKLVQIKLEKYNNLTNYRNYVTELYSVYDSNSIIIKKDCKIDNNKEDNYTYFFEYSKYPANKHDSELLMIAFINSIENSCVLELNK